jgi:NADP-dependent 3-hydroxy acid dehydrogenase YdfG
MVNLKQVKASNNGLKNTTSGLTAVFIGATSGIGMGAVKKFAQNTISPVVYLAGRSKSSAGPLLAELKSLNPEGNFIFIEAEVSLLKEVDKVCDEIKSKEQKIDLLFLSAGMLRTGSRQSKLENLSHEQGLIDIQQRILQRKGSQS